MRLLDLELKADLQGGEHLEQRAMALMVCAATLRSRAIELRDLPPERPADRYAEARAFVMGSGRASVSFIQRALRMGFNEAARYVEQMEKSGIVSAPGNDGARAVLLRAIPSDDAMSTE